MTEQPELITRVVFRTWRKIDGGDVIALMPDQEHNGHLCESYMHIGQHSGADYQLVLRATRPATPEEYAPLLAELTSIGYRVRPIARYTRRTV